MFSRPGLTLVLALVLAGCSSGRRIARTNDALRLERETLRSQVEALEAEVAELNTKLTELNARRGSPIPDDVLAALPRVASLTLNRFSTIWTENGTSEARFFVVPRDGRDRFIQAVGTLELRAVAIGQSGQEPEVLAERIISPTELRDAFTTGIGGSAYVFRLPIAASPASTVVLRAVFHDAITGSTHTAETLISPPVQSG